MSTITRPDAVTAYAEAVRDHLRALDAETLEELTGGLEADLADALLDDAAEDPELDLAALDIHDITVRFGPAEAYADELRQAAGVNLPAVAPRSRRRARDVLADAAAGWQADVLEVAERHPWFAATLDVLGALRPVWWVARAWVVFCGVQAVIGSRPVGVPSMFVDWVAIVVLVVLSTQWGRGRLGQGQLWHGLGRLASVVAAVVLPFLLLAVMADTLDQSSYDRGYADGSQSARGTGYGDPGGATGVGATNLFVYGPDGEPVDGAQIVDQDGRPFVLVDPTFGGAWDEAMLGDYLASGTDVPAGVVRGDLPLNVYPYRMVDADGTVWSDGGEPTLDPGLAEDPQWPAGSLFPVPGITPEAGDDAATSDDPAMPDDLPTSEDAATRGPDGASVENPGGASVVNPGGEPNP